MTLSPDKAADSSVPNLSNSLEPGVETKMASKAMLKKAPRLGSRRENPFLIQPFRE